MIATAGAPGLSSSSLKTRPISGATPMTSKKLRVTDAVETRSGSRPGIPLKLRDSLCVQARCSKTCCLFLPIEIIRERNGKILARPGRFVQHHDPIGIWIRKRPKQNGINDAKNGGVGANAEREGQHRDKSECRLFCQHPQGISKILENGMHGSYPLRNATTGSTTLARRAGHQQASRATVPSKIITPVIVNGSVGPMP